MIRIPLLVAFAAVALVHVARALDPLEVDPARSPTTRPPGSTNSLERATPSPASPRRPATSVMRTLFLSLALLWRRPPAPRTTPASRRSSAASATTPSPPTPTTRSHSATSTKGSS